MIKIKMFLIHVLIPLILGGFLYVTFRSKSLRMFNWFESIGLNSKISNLRECFSSIKHNLPSWVYFSLPDALWVYSFTSTILIIWACELTYWLIIPFATGVVVELLQGFLFIGTFDWIDLIFSTVGFFLSILSINYKNKKNHVQVF